MDENLREYEERGYTIIRQCIDIDKISNIIEDICLNKRDKIESYYEPDGKTIKKFEKIFNNVPQLKNLIDGNEIISNFIKKIFNEDGFFILKDKLNPKYKNKGTGWRMHFDGVFNSNTTKKGWYDYGSEFVNLVIPLTTSDEGNGTLRLLNKQKDFATYEDMISIMDTDYGHGIPKKKYYDKYYPLLKPINMKRGDILFFHPNCLHASSANLSNRDRKIYYLTYNKGSDGDNYERFYQDRSNSISIANGWTKH